MNNLYCIHDITADTHEMIMSFPNDGSAIRWMGTQLLREQEREKTTQEKSTNKIYLFPDEFELKKVGLWCPHTGKVTEDIVETVQSLKDIHQTFLDIPLPSNVRSTTE